MALETWEQGQLYAETLIDQASRENRLSPPDRNLLNALVMGAIRHQRALDSIIDGMREGRLDSLARQVLRIGIFQLLWMELPVHAAVNETVNSARKGVRGLINAILRRTDRERESIQQQLSQTQPAVLHSHPDWLYQRWVSQFGKEQTIQLMEWNQQPAPTLFRLNRLLTSDSRFIEQDELATPLGLEHFYLYKGMPPREWLQSGKIYIQDPATRHCVHLLNPRPGETILDACAAPGGKSFQIAELLNNQGNLISTDSNEKRLPRLKKNLEKLGVTCAKVEQHDWSQPAPSHWLGEFDAILLDVPCSNTGVLRRRVDARWRMTEESLAELSVIQAKILHSAIACLKPGGRIVYSTCSIDSAENTELIEAFLESNTRLKLVKEIHILPQIHHTDGAYSALLELSR